MVCGRKRKQCTPNSPSRPGEGKKFDGRWPPGARGSTKFSPGEWVPYLRLMYRHIWHIWHIYDIYMCASYYDKLYNIGIYYVLLLYFILCICLSYIILYFIVLHCNILYYVLLYFIILYYTVRIILYCSILSHILYYI